MGKRSRRRAKGGGSGSLPAKGGGSGSKPANGESSSAASATTTDYRDEDGNVLTLRDQLSEGTLRKLRDLDAKPAATAEDRWQRRAEFLFERLAVRWEIAGLPLEGQKELLGRYRLAGSSEREQVRKALAEHLAQRRPDVEL